MSLSIDTITVGGIEDRRLAIASGNAARVLSVGTSWTKLRIGARVSIDDSGGNITSTPRFYLGVLSNPANPLTNGPVGTTCSHFAGIVSVGGTWTRNAGPPVFYSMTSPTHAAAKKVGNTLTVTNFTGAARYSATPSTYRMIMMVEITKGSPNFTFSIIMPFNLTHDIPLISTFQNAITLPTMSDVFTYLSSVGGTNSYLNPASQTVAVSEATDGFLNAVCVGFDKAVVMHFSDVFAYKVS